MLFLVAGRDRGRAGRDEFRLPHPSSPGTASKTPEDRAIWRKHSGLADLLPSLRPEMVYVGLSAGSIAMASMFGETYFDPPKCSGEKLSSEDIVFAGPEGEITMTLVMAVANAEKWVGRLPVPTYAIDDETAVKVAEGTVEVVSEGHWELFNP